VDLGEVAIIIAGILRPNMAGTRWFSGVKQAGAAVDRARHAVPVAAKHHPCSP